MTTLGQRVAYNIRRLCKADGRRVEDIAAAAFVSADQLARHALLLLQEQAVGGESAPAVSAAIEAIEKEIDKAARNLYRYRERERPTEPGFDVLMSLASALERDPMEFFRPMPDEIVVVHERRERPTIVRRARSARRPKPLPVQFDGDATK